jgi:hypothetical protein
MNKTPSLSQQYSRQRATAGRSSQSRHAGSWEQFAQEQTVQNIHAMTPHELILPVSQKPVTAIRPNLVQLFEGGMIPDTLAPVVIEFISSFTDKTVEQGEEFIQQNWTQYVDIVNMVVTRVVLDPIFVLNTSEITPGSGKVHIRHMPLNDRIYLFNWAQGMEEGALKALEDFLAGSPADVGDRGPSTQLRDGPLSDPGDKSAELGGVHVAEGGLASMEVGDSAHRDDVSKAGSKATEGRRPLSDGEAVHLPGSYRPEADEEGQRSEGRPDRDSRSRGRPHRHARRRL